jgi:hypothetical protein
MISRNDKVGAERKENFTNNFGCRALREYQVNKVEAGGYGHPVT